MKVTIKYVIHPGRCVKKDRVFTDVRIIREGRLKFIRIEGNNYEVTLVSPQDVDSIIIKGE